MQGPRVPRVSPVRKKVEAAKMEQVEVISPRRIWEATKMEQMTEQVEETLPHRIWEVMKT